MRFVTFRLVWALLSGMLCAFSLQSVAITLKDSQAPQLQPPPGPLELTCWQDGEKVLQQSDLHDMSFSQDLNEKVMSFSQGGKKDARLMVLTIGRSLCIVKSSKK